jgi:hypothetical protein
MAGACKGSGIAFVDGVLSFHGRFTPLGPNFNLTPTDNALLVLSIAIAGRAFIDVGLRKGVEGGNLYGEDPLER